MQEEDVVHRLLDECKLVFTNVNGNGGVDSYNHLLRSSCDIVYEVVRLLPLAHQVGLAPHNMSCHITLLGEPLL